MAVILVKSSSTFHILCLWYKLLQYKYELIDRQFCFNPVRLLMLYESFPCILVLFALTKNSITAIA